MDKERQSQLELFSQLKEEKTAGLKQAGNFSFFSYARKREKAILAVIGFIITAVISFSLGAEKGKGASVKKTGAYTDIAVKTAPEKPLEQPAAPAKKEETKVKEKEIDSAGGYSIQVATYSKKDLAQLEAKRLKEKGFFTILQPRGRYIVLYVGKFPDKNSARPLFMELKKKYHDCVIRRL